MLLYGPLNNLYSKLTSPDNSLYTSHFRAELNSRIFSRLVKSLSSSISRENFVDSGLSETISRWIRTLISLSEISLFSATAETVSVIQLPREADINSTGQRVSRLSASRRATSILRLPINTFASPSLYSTITTFFSAIIHTAPLPNQQVLFLVFQIQFFYKIW